MTTECVTTEQNNVDCEHNSTNPDSQSAIEPQRLPNVIGQNADEDQSEIKEVAVHVLHDERKGTFAPVALARFAESAGRWVGPECFVIRASIIIAGEPESTGRPKNKEGWREEHPAWPPVRLWTKPTVRRIAK